MDIHDLGTPAADSVAGQQTQIFHISTAAPEATTVNFLLLSNLPQRHYKGSPETSVVVERLSS